MAWEGVLLALREVRDSQTSNEDLLESISSDMALETPQTLTTWGYRSQTPDLQTLFLCRSSYRYPESTTDGAIVLNESVDRSNPRVSYADTTVEALQTYYYSLFIEHSGLFSLDLAQEFDIDRLGESKCCFGHFFFVEDKVIGVGDGGTTTFTGYLGDEKVQPLSISIQTIAGSVAREVYDDGRENLKGYINLGSPDDCFIRYASGEYSVVFQTAPDYNEYITASYAYDVGVYWILSRNTSGAEVLWSFDSNTLLCRESLSLDFLSKESAVSITGFSVSGSTRIFRLVTTKRFVEASVLSSATSISSSDISTEWKLSEALGPGYNVTGSCEDVISEASKPTIGVRILDAANQTANLFNTSTGALERALDLSGFTELDDLVGISTYRAGVGFTCFGSGKAVYGVWYTETAPDNTDITLIAPVQRPLNSDFSIALADLLITDNGLRLLKIMEFADMQYLLQSEEKQLLHKDVTGLWRLNESSGDALDTSGSGIDATVSSLVQREQPGKFAYSYLMNYGEDPLFELFSRDNGIGGLLPELSINNTEVTPEFRYKGEDASLSYLDCWTYGEDLAASNVLGSTSPEFNAGSPLSGKYDDSFRLVSVASDPLQFVAPNSDLGDLGSTGDAVIEIVAAFDGSGAGASILSKRNISPGWILYRNGSGLSFTMTDASGSTTVSTDVGTSLADGEWFHAIIFIDRDENSTNGSRIIVNGQPSSSGANFSVRGDNTAPIPFIIGGYTFPVWLQRISYLAMWKQDDWFPGGSYNVTLWNAVAIERFHLFAGAYPSRAVGTATPVFSKALKAFIDKVEGTARKLYPVSPNWPRIVSREDGSSNLIKGYLSEPAVTNEITRSQEIDDVGVWTPAAASVTGDSTTSPEKETTADTLSEDGTNAIHKVSQGSVNKDDASVYTLSVWAKPINRDWIWISSSTGPTASCFFDVNAGIVGTSSNCTGAIEDWGDGWYRCSITFTTTSAVATTIVLATAQADGVNSFLGLTQDSTYFWGAQFEKSPMATSYVLTAAGTAQRSADLLEFAADDGNFNLAGAEGALSCDVLIDNQDTFDDATIANIHDSSNNNILHLRHRASDDSAVFSVYDGGVLQDDVVSTTDISSGDIVSLRSKWSTGSYSLYIDSVEEDSSAGGSVPTNSGMNLITVGDYDGVSPANLKGVISSLRIYKSSFSPTGEVPFSVILGSALDIDDGFVSFWWKEPYTGFIPQSSKVTLLKIQETPNYFLSVEITSSGVLQAVMQRGAAVDAVTLSYSIQAIDFKVFSQILVLWDVTGVVPRFELYVDQIKADSSTDTRLYESWSPVADVTLYLAPSCKGYYDELVLSKIGSDKAPFSKYTAVTLGNRAFALSGRDYSDGKVAFRNKLKSYFSEEVIEHDYNSVVSSPSQELTDGELIFREDSTDLVLGDLGRLSRLVGLFLDRIVDKRDYFMNHSRLRSVEDSYIRYLGELINAKEIESTWNVDIKRRFLEVYWFCRKWRGNYRAFVEMARFLGFRIWLPESDIPAIISRRYLDSCVDSSRYCTPFDSSVFDSGDSSYHLAALGFLLFSGDYSSASGGTSAAAYRKFTDSSVANFEEIAEVGSLLRVYDIDTSGDNGYYYVRVVTSGYLMVDRDWPVGGLSALNYHLHWRVPEVDPYKGTVFSRFKSVKARWQKLEYTVPSVHPTYQVHKDWFEQSNPLNINLRSIITDGSTFVAVGDSTGSSPYVISSDDAITWVQRTCPGGATKLANIFSDGSSFTAVGDPSGGDALIVTSLDGTTWTERANPVNTYLQAVTHGNSLWVTAGGVGTVMTSPDSVTWTVRAQPLGAGVTFNAAAYGGGLFVIVNAGDKMISSPDGITWTARTAGSSTGIQGICYGDGKFVAVGNNSDGIPYIVVSADAISWTRATNVPIKVVGTGLTEVSYSELFERFTAVGPTDGADANVFISYDGLNWTEEENPKSFSLEGITHNNGSTEETAHAVAVGVADGADAYIVKSI